MLPRCKIAELYDNTVDTNIYFLPTKGKKECMLKELWRTVHSLIDKKCWKLMGRGSWESKKKNPLHMLSLSFPPFSLSYTDSFYTDKHTLGKAIVTQK